MVTIESKINLSELESKIKSSDKFVAYFTGSVDENGISWCPDCNDAKPAYKHLKEKYSSLPTESFFIERNVWKNQENEFRKSKYFKVDSVPTLIYYEQGVEMVRLKENHITIEGLDDYLS